MIVVDSSVALAIFFGDASAPALLARLAADVDRVMSVASYVETGTLLAGRRRTDRFRAVEDLDRFLDEAGIVLVPVDIGQARLAVRARIQLGEGTGRGGGADFGHAFACALARARAAPLLFVGDEFGPTDAAVALSPGR